MSVVLVQVAGLLVAYVAAWVAFFALPPDHLGGENGLGTRLVGGAAAVVGAVAVPAGCWEAWRRWRRPLALVLGGLAAAAVLVVAVGWAFQLDWG